MNKPNLIKDNSYAFAIRIVKLRKHIEETKREFVLSKQILRSGTSVGALVRESEQAESKADFIHKLSIALKEANETEYWLLLMRDTDYLSMEEFNSIHPDCGELIRLLTAIIKSTKDNIKRKQTPKEKE